MEDISATGQTKITKEVSKDGVKLFVIASRAGTESWHLSVRDAYGICSNRLELFPGTQLAIKAGLHVIDKECMEPFMDTEGFEYLFEE